MNEDPHSPPDAPPVGPAVRRAGAAPGETPLRAQVFNAAQMAVHGRQLAAHHALSRHEGADGLRERLLDNAALIARAGASLTRAGKAGETLDPAAAGLLDHYHLIDAQIRIAHRALLQRYCRELPCLGVPREAAGQPRIYQLALELVAHGDGRIEHESLERFVAAYQEGAPLALGELRALPDMLRLALIDNLRRIAARLERGREQRKLARGWAERMLMTAEQRPGDLVLLVADMARAVPALDAAFVAELTRRLQEGGTGVSQVLQWIGARLGDQGLSVDRQLQLDSEARAADGVSAANSIDSLRLVAATDWPAFVETMAAAEQVLRRDPAGIHARMDHATRAHYREALARLAREMGKAGHDETQVADEALALAGQPRDPAEGGLDARTRHIGLYLTGSGVAALRARLKTGEGRGAALRASLRSSLRDLADKKPLLLYLATAGALTLLFTMALLLRAYRDGAGLALLLALGALAVFGAAELALAATDALARSLTRALVPPRPLPRLDFSDGIPDDARTLVAVPAILRGSDDVAALAASLEMHYLGNRERNLRFCLLTDFADAPAQTMPDDAALLEAARTAIANLNARHGGADGTAPFLLLQRPRVWSRSEGAWIGDDRRYGQLADLAAFLRDGARERFALVEGETGALETLRYLCVLDPAARLAHGGVRRLVATLAHPLNQPSFDAAGVRVIAGHGLLQPCPVPALPGEAAARYERRAARLHGNGTQLVQDLFGVVPANGQGLYEIDSLRRVLAQRLPTGALLAHLLPMGSALRCAQVDDVALHAPAPSRYGDDVARRHRRLRGQWQLALCLRRLSGLPPLARWTLLDALRGALVAPSLLAALVLCWALLPEPAFWGAAALSVFFLPAFGDVLAGLARKPGDMLWRQHLDNWWRDTRNALGQAAMRTAFMPHEAWIGLDAAARAGWRMLVARRKLLEQCPRALARSSADMEANWRNMWFGPVLAVGSAVLLTFLHPFALFAGAPLLLLWFLSPVLAWWLSQPRQQHAQHATDLPAQQALFLARLARRTWSYFETAVGTSTNWLPPAAIQQHPREMVEARTTPGDIGYGLLASLCAWDFGFIPQSDLLMRLRAAFDSIDLLERHLGHFYAGYDSGTLAPLEPLRVSTTESGTLAAHLLTLAGGLEALAETPIASTRTLDGIRATLAVLDEHAQGASQALPQVLHEALAHCHAQLTPERCRNLDTLPGLADCLQGAAAAAAALAAALPDDADASLRDWAMRLDAGCAAALADLFALAPWIRAVQEYVLDASLTRIPSLRELAQTKYAGADLALARMVEEGAAGAHLRLQEIDALARRARAFADMDFDFLYLRGSGLLAGGYDLAEERLEDASGYLASEARLASFVGIARGQLPAAHWDALERPLCVVEGEQLLQSEDGALSDYLAPLLVMPAWRDTLLDRTYRAVVHAQIGYARRQDTPWGISRSGCNTVDREMQYACRSFGVPGTGIRRGLADDLVIAPYAAMLALMVEPQAAAANLERLAALGGIGAHGFYDAIDFTGARLPPGRKHAIVRAWRSRHQGMGLLALSSFLHGQPMARRFAADPQLRAALPLLQERVPRAGAFEPPAFELDAAQIAPPQTPLPTRVVRRPGMLQPQVQLLSNGRYHVMVTSDGGGYSLREGLALTRWRGDAAGGDGGLFCHLRDLDSGALWSNAWQPTLAEPERYEAVFSEGSVQLRRRDHGIALTTQIAVSPEDDVELRRMRVRNLSNRTRRIEFTSFCEVALAPAGDAGPRDWSPFAQSEILAGRRALLCTRPARAAGTAVPWLLHLMRVEGGADAASFATSRTQLLGRGRGTPPMATAAPGPLAGTGTVHEPVRDPVLAIRRVLTLAPGEERSVDLVLGAAATRDAALELVDRYAQADHADRAFELAWIRGQALLRHLNASEADGQLYGSLAGSVLYVNRALRADPAVIARNRRDRSSLQPLGPGGELPIVLTHVRGQAGLELVRQLLAAHAWWRLNGLVADLVVWYGDGTGYRQGLHQQIMAMVAACLGADTLDRPGGVFVRAIESIPDEDRILMQAAARVVLLDEHGSLAEQLRRAVPAAGPAASSPPAREAAEAPVHDLPLPELCFDNGIGGFSPDGREYLVRSGPGRAAPAPWPNLLASPAFASVVNDSGVSHTWSGDPEGGRLTTPGDGLPGYGGEAFYVRDEEGGMCWSPTPLPAPSGGAYLTRHGFGYSVFEHLAHGIHSEMTSFVAFDAPLKYTVLRLRNDGASARRLSVTGYVEWVLGASRTEAAPHVVSARDPASGALLARSAWTPGLADRTGFFHVDAQPASFTCDRMAFLGRGRDLAHPLALERAGLDGSLDAGCDPCAALQVAVSLQPGEQKELVFMLGVGEGRDLGAYIGRHQGALAAGVALDRVHAWWSETLGGLQIETPDPSLDLLANGWLMVRAIAGGLWAGGMRAVGSGLQDAMAAVHLSPRLLRAQLLRCAASQLVEGGLRTRSSGEHLWLPLALCRYVRTTGDFAVLDERVPYLEEALLEAGQAAEDGELYGHCVRAIRRGLRVGAHGLPLVDGGGPVAGMDLVGCEGPGESVRLAFLLVEALDCFAEVAQRRGDYGFVLTCGAAARALRTQIEEHGWDGTGYRRGYREDGTPLGAGETDAGRTGARMDARIDTLTQSWAVLSGGADPGRAAAAMAALPPFDPSSLCGNGDGDTAAGIQAAMAFARLGEEERAWALLEMLDPVRRGATPDDVERDGCAPYLLPDSVGYATPPIGCGDGSWYTGSAGWMYRLIVESLLGLERVGERLVLAPLLPPHWPGFRMRYRYRATIWDIEVRGAAAQALLVDGRPVEGNSVQLVDDGAPHRVEVLVARRQDAALAAHIDTQSRSMP